MQSRILDLGRRHGLTAYDATYLELAMRTGGMLATFDRKLADAARVAGVRVFGDAA
jgi:predicted nucleic acid-binding protein